MPRNPHAICHECKQLVPAFTLLRDVPRYSVHLAGEPGHLEVCPLSGKPINLDTYRLVTP